MRYVVLRTPSTMPIYKRKTTRGNWDVGAMKEAIENVRCHELSLCAESKFYDVPKATLLRRVANKNKIAIQGRKHLGRHQQTFNGLLKIKHRPRLV